MNSDQKQKLLGLLELANQYPSPHNGQPIEIHPQPAGNLEVSFDTQRGLTATPISYLFSFVTIGVFIRHLELCAEALGHSISVKLMLPEQAEMASGKLLACATVEVKYDINSPDPDLEQVIRRRQTSRKKYTSGLSSEQQRELIDIAKMHGLKLTLARPEVATKILWLNQRAVFDDMFNEPVRKELNHWLRYSEKEKVEKRDGLAYDCMELGGSALRFTVNHYKILRWPVISQILREYYLRTMADSSTVGYVTAQFQTEQQSYEVGRTIIDLWVQLTRHGAYLHPFGTIVANDEAHQDFIDLVSLHNETRSDYVVFIFRAGFSKVPYESERIPVGEHLLKEVV